GGMQGLHSLGKERFLDRLNYTTRLLYVMGIIAFHFSKLFDQYQSNRIAQAWRFQSQCIESGRGKTWSPVLIMSA
ncbi:hypothetical protein, partial [Microvirga sp. P5_D2]